MEITLRKVLFCCLGILSAVAFLLVFIIKFEVIGTPEMDVRPVLANASMLECLTKSSFGTVFEKNFYHGFVNSSVASPSLSVHLAATIDNSCRQCKTFAVIALIAIIGMFIAPLSVFFPKKFKWGRLISSSLFVVMIVLAFISFTGFMGLLTYENGGEVWSEPKAMTNIIFLVVGVLLYVAMVVVPSLIKDKTLIKIGKK